MIAKVLMSCVAALAVCLSFTATPAPAEADAGRDSAPAAVKSVDGESYHFGPYATIRRANEVAAYYRSLGYYASAPYHNGDGYYVDVSG